METNPQQKLSACPENKKFWTCNGTAFTSLHELAHGLKGMDDGTFSHHVNDHKNDFATWVNDVVGDNTLSQGLHHMKNKHAMEKRVALRVRFLELLSEGAGSFTKKKTVRQTTKKTVARTTTKKKSVRKAAMKGSRRR